MPFDLVASDQKGGAGGTCVLRGCVPKKLMVYGGEFAQAFKDSQGFGCAPLLQDLLDTLTYDRDVVQFAMSARKVHSMNVQTCSPPRQLSQRGNSCCQAHV